MDRRHCHRRTCSRHSPPFAPSTGQKPVRGRLRGGKQTSDVKLYPPHILIMYLPIFVDVYRYYTLSVSYSLKKPYKRKNVPMFSKDVRSYISTKKKGRYFIRPPNKKKLYIPNFYILFARLLRRTGEAFRFLHIFAAVNFN